MTNQEAQDQLRQLIADSEKDLNALREVKERRERGGSTITSTPFLVITDDGLLVESAEDDKYRLGYPRVQNGLFGGTRFNRKGAEIIRETFQKRFNGSGAAELTFTFRIVNEAEAVDAFIAYQENLIKVLRKHVT